MKKHSLFLVTMLFFSLSSYSQNFKGFSIGPEIHLPLSGSTGNYFEMGYGGNLTIPIMHKSNFEINASIGYVWYDMNSITAYFNSYNDVSAYYELHSIPVKMMCSYYIGTTKKNKISVITGLAYQTFKEELLGLIDVTGGFIHDYNETSLFPIILGVQYERYLFWRISAYVNVETHTSSYRFPNDSGSGSSYLDLPTFTSTGLRFNL